MRYYNPLLDTVTTDSTSSAEFIVPIGILNHDGANQSFQNGVQFAWDSTSLALYKTCPYKYKLKMIDQWDLKITPPPLAFGIYIHRIFQTWFQLTAINMDKQTALLRCVRLAGLLGETLPSGDSARQKEQLIRTTVWYIEQFWEDTAETVILADNKPAVEFSFTLPLFEDNNEQIYLCGHIDRLVRFSGKTLAADYKTSKYQLDDKFFRKFKPITQFPIYVAATHIIAEATQEVPGTDGLLVDGIQLGVNYNRYARRIIPFTLEEIEEYIHDMEYWIRNARLASQAGHFPRNEESCGQYGGCEFLDICNKPPALREKYLKGHFTKKTWDPIRSR